MKLLHLAAIAVATVGLAKSETIFIANHSFEDLPITGLLGTCGLGCSFSTTANIPGWVSTNNNNQGQFRPGTQLGNTSAFTSLSDGITSAYINNGPAITQTVAPLVSVGVTYILRVDLGRRNDALGSTFNSGARLRVNGNVFNATGSTPAQGLWSTFTAYYTGSNADLGQSITVELFKTGGVQANFDNVRLDAIPEPGQTSVLGLAAIAGMLALARGGRQLKR